MPDHFPLLPVGHHQESELVLHDDGPDHSVDKARPREQIVPANHSFLQPLPVLLRDTLPAHRGTLGVQVMTRTVVHDHFPLLVALLHGRNIDDLQNGRHVHLMAQIRYGIE